MLAIIMLLTMIISSLISLAICSVPSFDKEVEDLEQAMYLNEKYKEEIKNSKH